MARVFEVRSRGGRTALTAALCRPLAFVLTGGRVGRRDEHRRWVECDYPQRPVSRRGDSWAFIPSNSSRQSWFLRYTNMSIKFNDRQLVLLSAASQRDDHCLVPPAGPRRGQVQKATAKLLEAGLLKEIKAKAGAPIWRRDDESGQTYALKLTAAGAKAIAVDETWPSEGEAEPGPSDRLRRSEARTQFRPRSGH